MIKRVLFFRYLLILLILLGCAHVVQQPTPSGNGDTTTTTINEDIVPTPPTEPTYTNDGVTGGTFSSSDGDFSATAPDGSIPSGLSVNPTVTEVSVDEDAALAEGETKVSDAYQLNLDSIDHFLTTSTVEITLAFDSTNIPSEKLTSQYVYANVYLPDTGNLLSISGTISGTTLTLNTKGLAKNAIYMVVYNPDIRIVYPSASASSLSRAFETPTNWAASSGNWKVIYDPNHALLRTVVAGILNTTADSLSNEAIDGVIQERIADNAAIAAARYEGAGFRQPNLHIDRTSAEAYYLIHMRTNGRGSSFSFTRPDENASFEGYVTGRLNIAPTRMDDAVGSNLGSIVASIAHEMLHAIQLGYDIGTSTDSRPVKEGTAVPYGILIDKYGSTADQAGTEPLLRPSPAQAQKLSDYLLYGMAGASKSPAYRHQDFFTWVARKYGTNSLGGWVPTLFEQIKTDLDTAYAANNNANIYIQPSREAVLASMNTAFVSEFGAGVTLPVVYFNFAKDRAMEHTTALRTGEPAAGTLNTAVFATTATKSVTVEDPETVPSNPVEETFTNVAGYSTRVLTFTPAQAKDDVNISITVTSTTAALGSTMRAALYREGSTTGIELLGVKNLTDYPSSTDDIHI